MLGNTLGDALGIRLSDSLGNVVNIRGGADGDMLGDALGDEREETLGEGL